MTPALRWLWIAGAIGLAVGSVDVPLVPGGFVLVPEIAVLLVAVAGGVTAARGTSVGRAWLTLAWSVPVLPLVAGVAVFLWLVDERADPLAVVLLLTLGVFVVLATWIVFVIALVVELVRRRRRRFGEARPAWKNDPTPPSYS